MARWRDRLRRRMDSGALLRRTPAPVEPARRVPTTEGAFLVASWCSRPTRRRVS